MKRYRLAVCKGMDCKRNGADAVFKTFGDALRAGELTGRCELYRGGCYGLCEDGPNVVIREDTGKKKEPFSREDFQLMGTAGEVYYPAMSPEKALQVVAEHVGRDAPVEALKADEDG